MMKDCLIDTITGDMLPRLPEGYVLLPKNFAKGSINTFEGLSCFPGEYRKGWEVGLNYTGIGSPGLRYAVREDSELARINKVGFGFCPSPFGWHNPHHITPADLPDGYPVGYRLLCRDEIGIRHSACPHIQAMTEAGTQTSCAMYGQATDVTYITKARYGTLPPVETHAFSECANMTAKVGKVLEARKSPDISYIEGHKISGLEVGDRVRILRPAVADEAGWDNEWVDDMDETVSKVGEIVSDGQEMGFTVLVPNPDGDDYEYNYPYFVLVKVPNRDRSIDDVEKEIAKYILQNLSHDPTDPALVANYREFLKAVQIRQGLDIAVHPKDVRVRIALALLHGIQIDTYRQDYVANYLTFTLALQTYDQLRFPLESGDVESTVHEHMLDAILECPCNSDHISNYLEYMKAVKIRQDLD